MTDLERVREKRKTIISIIVVSCGFGIIFGIIGFFIICNPLQISATDISQFKQNTLRDTFLIVTFWVLLPEGMVILLLGYLWGRRIEKKNWFNRIDAETRKIIEDLKRRLKYEEDKAVDFNSRKSKLLAIIRRQEEMITNSRISTAAKINYTGILE